MREGDLRLSATFSSNIGQLMFNICDCFIAKLVYKTQVHVGKLYGLSNTARKKSNLGKLPKAVATADRIRNAVVNELLLRVHHFVRFFVLVEGCFVWAKKSIQLQISFFQPPSWARESELIQTCPLDATVIVQADGRSGLCCCTVGSCCRAGT
jgi:hypothetical protein